MTTKYQIVGQHPRSSGIIVVCTSSAGSYLAHVLAPGYEPQMLPGTEGVVLYRPLYPIHTNSEGCLFLRNPEGLGNFGVSFYDFNTQRTQDLVAPGTGCSGVQIASTGWGAAWTQTTESGIGIYIKSIDRPDRPELVYQTSEGGWFLFGWCERGMLLTQDLSRQITLLHLLEPGHNGYERRTLIDADRARGVELIWAEFAPDDSIVFVSRMLGGFKALFRLDHDRFTRLTPKAHMDMTGFSFSEDGQRLAFTQNTPTGTSLFKSIDLRTRQVTILGGPNQGIFADPRGQVANCHDVGRTSFVQEFIEGVDYDPIVWIGTPSTPDDESSHVSTFWVPWQDHRINCVRYDPAERFRKSGQQPVILYTRGGPALQSLAGYPGIVVSALLRQGFVVVLPNYPGSVGQGEEFFSLPNGPHRERSVASLEPVIDWIARQSDLDENNISMLGHSYGGYLTQEAIHRYHKRLRSGVSVCGFCAFERLILDDPTPADRHQRFLNYGWGDWESFEHDPQHPARVAMREQLDPLRNAARITKPLLLIHGTKDHVVPVRHSELMAAQCPTAELMIVDGAGHNIFHQPPDEVVQRIVTSFTRDT